jgi:two-component system cell cycle response regulator DivK
MKARILIIEDNEKNMYMETFLLEYKGYKVYQAMNGMDGIEITKREKPDLILLDIQLPKMDGYAIAKELRNNKEISNIPIVAVTSYAMTGDREKVMQSGCDGYIEKPINPDTFVRDVVKFIKL